MKNLLHPMARYDVRTVDVFFGGNEREVIAESMKLAYDAQKYLPKGQNILYVNTLIDGRSLGEVIEQHIRRDARIYSLTFLGKSFMDRLKFLEHSIKEKNVSLLVINSFDAAALTQRHRVLLYQWIRAIRNTYGIRIVVFMQSLPGYYGTNGSMRFIAQTLTCVGAYLQETAEFFETRIESETKEAEDFEKTRHEEEVEEKLDEELEVAEESVVDEAAVEEEVVAATVEAEPVEQAVSEEVVDEVVVEDVHVIDSPEPAHVAADSTDWAKSVIDEMKASIAAEMLESARKLGESAKKLEAAAECAAEKLAKAHDLAYGETKSSTNGSLKNKDLDI